MRCWAVALFAKAAASLRGGGGECRRRALGFGVEGVQCARARRASRGGVRCWRPGGATGVGTGGGVGLSDGDGHVRQCGGGWTTVFIRGLVGGTHIYR